MGAVYVGTLYAVQFEGEDPEDCEERTIGVDPDLGVVTAPTRADLRHGDYDEPPDKCGRRVVRLWYRRRRTDYGSNNLWYHDLTDTEGFPRDRKHGPPLVVLRGPDVYICDEPGSFLCG